MSQIDLSQLLEKYRQRHWRIATAESCTGGMVAAALTEIAGSSDVFDRGFVTYSNQAKTDMLGIPAELIARHGAVSAEVAQAMAVGTLSHSNADVALSITGIAGPGGGSHEKPVGLVFLACARKGLPAQLVRQLFQGERHHVREGARQLGLQMLLAEVT
jgi:nicotinamide-nucleotide amidase